MKHFQMLFITIIFATVSSSSMLLDKNSPVCIDDFFIQNNQFYYLDSATQNWFSGGNEDHLSTFITPGFQYDSETNSCLPQPHLILGMDIKDFNFLMALIGIIFGGSFMFFTIKLFETVGGKR